MIQLALDTSALTPSAAILKDEAVIAAWTGSTDAHHSSTLLGGIDSCLSEAGYALKDMEFLSVGIGPGMFTGLRVGVATAKFLADVHSLQLAPVSSLAALALGAKNAVPAGKRLWALNDARSQRVYALCVEPGSLSAELQPSEAEEVAWKPEELAPKLRAGDVLVGEGALAFRSSWPSGVVIPEAPELHFPHAGCIGLLGLAAQKRNALRDPSEVVPRYLKTGQNHLP